MKYGILLIQEELFKTIESETYQGGVQMGLTPSSSMTTLTV